MPPDDTPEYGPGEKPLQVRRRTDGLHEFTAKAPPTFTFDLPTVRRHSVEQPLMLDRQVVVTDDDGQPHVGVAQVQVGAIAPWQEYDEAAGTVTIRCANATVVYDVTRSSDPEDRRLSGTLRSEEPADG